MRSGWNGSRIRRSSGLFNRRSSRSAYGCTAVRLQETRPASQSEAGHGETAISPEDLAGIRSRPGPYRQSHLRSIRSLKNPIRAAAPTNALPPRRVKRGPPRRCRTARELLDHLRDPAEELLEPAAGRKRRGGEDLVNVPVGERRRSGRRRHRPLASPGRAGRSSGPSASRGAPPRPPAPAPSSARDGIPKAPRMPAAASARARACPTSPIRAGRRPPGARRRVHVVGPHEASRGLRPRNAAYCAARANAPRGRLREPVGGNTRRAGGGLCRRASDPELDGPGGAHETEQRGLRDAALALALEHPGESPAPSSGDRIRPRRRRSRSTHPPRDGQRRVTAFSYSDTEASGPRSTTPGPAMTRPCASQASAQIVSSPARVADDGDPLAAWQGLAREQRGNVEHLLERVRADDARLPEERLDVRLVQRDSPDVRPGEVVPRPAAGALHAEDRLSVGEPPGDARKAPRIAERLEVEERDVGRRVTPPRTGAGRFPRRPPGCRPKRNWRSRGSRSSARISG